MDLFTRMWSKAEHTTKGSAHDRLMGMLDDESELAELLSTPGTSMTSSRRLALRTIAHHFEVWDGGGVASSDGPLTAGEATESPSEPDLSDHLETPEPLTHTDASPASTPQEPAGEEVSEGAGPETTDPQTAGPVIATPPGDEQGPEQTVDQSGPELHSNTCADTDTLPTPAKKRGPQDTAEEAVKRPKRAPQNPWRRFLKITQLSVPEALREHIATYGTHPDRFLTDDSHLQHDITGLGSGSASDAFIACYLYTMELQRRRGIDSWRWHFTILMFHDLVKIVRPKGTGRIGCVMYEELAILLQILEMRLAVPIQVALAHINEWSRQGGKLDVLIAEFGPGCSFFLEKELSPDFLSNKFTASGPYHDAAFAHLRNLGLPQLASESRANELGFAVRETLIGPFHAVTFGHGDVRDRSQAGPAIDAANEIAG